MIRNRFPFLLGTVFAVSLLFATAGCETDSASDIAINISPSGGTLNAGQTIQLTASGGWNYRWSCDQEKGYLSSTTGSKVSYTAYSASSNTTHTITVTGIGSTSGGTNNTAYASSYTASASFKSK